MAQLGNPLSFPYAVEALLVYLACAGTMTGARRAQPHEMLAETAVEFCLHLPYNEP